MSVLAFKTSRSRIAGIILVSLIYLQSLLILDKGFLLDRKISNMFFDFSCHAENARRCWLLDKSDRHLSFLLHNLPVHIFTAIGIFAFCALVASFRYKKLRQYRELNILLLIGLIAVPSIVGFLKSATGHYCPGQLSVYGGPVGMPGLMQPKARCFPAGFPAGGFSFLVLYFGSLPPFWKHLGLYSGLGIGGVLSMLQIARGEHFVSHCLATFMTALFVGMLVSIFRQYRQGHYNALIDD